MRIEVKSLRATSSLAPRGQTHTVEIVKTSAGCTHVFKKYNDETRATLQPDVLREVADWRWGLRSNDREWLDAHGAWIRHVVYDRKEIVGVLIPVAPAQCWTLQRNEHVPREGSKLVGTSERGERFNLPRRLHLMGELLKTVLWFHERNVVLGDIQLANFLIGDDTDIFLIDLDSAWVRGKCAFPLTENPRYAAEFDTGRQTRRTDLYKYALAATKVLALNGAALNASLSAKAMSSYQNDILTDLLLGNEEDTSVLASLASMWSLCVGSSGETVFVPDAVNRVPSTEPPSHLISGTPPAMDHCADPSSRPAHTTASQVASPSVPSGASRSPAQSNTPTSTREKARTVVLILVALTVLAVATYVVFFL